MSDWSWDEGLITDADDRQIALTMTRMELGEWRVVAMWANHHANQFWSTYTGVDGNDCPWCRSSTFECISRDIDPYKIGKVVTAAYRCDRCSNVWKRQEHPNAKYETT